MSADVVSPVGNLSARAFDSAVAEQLAQVESDDLVWTDGTDESGDVTLVGKLAPALWQVRADPVQIEAAKAFRKAAPYNPLFEEAFQLMRDFWAVPEYDDMMKSCQREFCAVFQDGADPVAAADQVQAEHEAILKKRGRTR